MSKTELKEVLHHYVGARVRVTWEDASVGEFTLDMITPGMIMSTDLIAPPGTQNTDIEILDWDGKDPKLQLFLQRPTDLSPEQMAQYKSLCYIFEHRDLRIESDTPESLCWLFANKIDAFNLIDRGLAIDINEGKKQEPESYFKSGNWEKQFIG